MEYLLLEPESKRSRVGVEVDMFRQQSESDSLKILRLRSPGEYIPTLGYVDSKAALCPTGSSILPVGPPHKLTFGLGTSARSADESTKFKGKRRPSE